MLHVNSYETRAAAWSDSVLCKGTSIAVLQVDSSTDYSIRKRRRPLLKTRLLDEWVELICLSLLMRKGYLSSSTHTRRSVPVLVASVEPARPPHMWLHIWRGALRYDVASCLPAGAPETQTGIPQPDRSLHVVAQSITGLYLLYKYLKEVLF